MKKQIWSLSVIIVIACSQPVNPDNHDMIIEELKSSYPTGTEFMVEEQDQGIQISFIQDGDKYKAVYDDQKWVYTDQYISSTDLSKEIVEKLALQYPSATVTQSIKRSSLENTKYVLEMYDDEVIYVLELDQNGSIIDYHDKNELY